MARQNDAAIDLWANGGKKIHLLAIIRHIEQHIDAMRLQIGFDVADDLAIWLATNGRECHKVGQKIDCSLKTVRHRSDHMDMLRKITQPDTTRSRNVQSLAQFHSPIIHPHAQNHMDDSVLRHNCPLRRPQ